MPVVSVHPEADLESRPNAREPTQDELLQLELFQKLQKKPDIAKFPQSMVIRRIAKGDIICRQGEAGASAFYVLTTDDVLRLDKHRLDQSQKKLAKLEGETPDAAQVAQLRKLQEEYRREISVFEQRKAEQAAEESTQSDGGMGPTVATAYLLVDSPDRRAKAKGGLFGGLRRVFGSGKSSSPPSPESISIDGPSDVDYVKRTSPMFEGDIFGEMSCLSFAPRSATVVADVDCYMLEFLRSIFDQIQRDASYKERVEEVYRNRVLATQFRRTELFSDLRPEEIDFVRQNVNLEIVEPGTVICEEGDESDCVYLIRSGLVQVVKNANVSLALEDIVDWSKLSSSLRKGEEQEVTAPANKPSVKPTADRVKPTAAKAVRRDPAETGGKEAASIKPAATPGKEKAAPIKPAATPRKVLSPKTPAATPDKVAAPKRPAAMGNPLDALKGRTAKPSVSPPQKVWQTLPATARDAVRRLAESESSNESDKQIVIDGLNRMIRDTAFVTSADLKQLRDSHETLAPVRAFGKAEKNWTGLDARVAGRLLLEAIYPGCIRSRSRSGKTPRTVAYLSRGEIFGEMGVVDDQQSKRTATVIAYDHPPDSSGRRPSRLEIVRIDKAVFRELLERSPELRRKIKAEIELRRGGLEKIETQRIWESDVLTESSEFRDMGFAQGQQLLLIDLDRCTRCGDCIRACINTHDDGYTRLFLDGPRFDRFLVPSACRNCRNPACMIGCPVGSIQRGDDGEILIRDWCIGCGICAKQCPYDSIQMHDTGLVPERAIGWRYTAAAIDKNKRWNRRGYSAEGWHTTLSPIQCDFDFLANLKQQKITERDGPYKVYFRYAFNSSADEVGREVQFRLEIESHAETLEVWINGNEVELIEEQKRNRRTGKYVPQTTDLGSFLRKGENVVAAAVTLPVSEGQPVLKLRLDRVPEIDQLPPEGTEAEAKVVTEKAVVCDLCSSLPSKDPACVAQCPHDAAFRIDALYEPQRLVPSKG